MKKYWHTVNRSLYAMPISFNTLDFVLFLNIWHPFGVVQWYHFEVTLNINNLNSIGWNIRGFSALCWHQWIHCMHRISKHTLTKIHPPTMSNVSFTIHTPLQRTLYPTGPTIPYTYCISTLASNINPTIPRNIIQKFPVQFFGTDTSTAFDQCGILNLYLLPF